MRKPDVLCLQETKCPDEFFPHKAFEGLGYTHRLVQGMKSYNGVAILSKVPFTANNIHHRCGKEDCRHIEAALDIGGDPILLDNLYIPAGGDIPDPELNDKFAHKLDFYREMAEWFADRKPRPRARKGLRRIAVGDLNVAPLEHDVWSHKQLLKIVSHTPVEVEPVRPHEGVARLDRRAAPFRARGQEALFVVELPQQRLARLQPRPPARPYPGLAGLVRRHSGAIASTSDTRDWKKASDHVPVMATFEVEGEKHGIVGFIGILIIGLIVGLLARFITPGPNPRGIIVTIVIGIVGAVIATYGGQALGLYRPGEAAGFIGSVVGAVVLLVLLRLFSR